MVLALHPQSAVARRPVFEDPARVVGGAVVHRHDLELGQGLAGETLQALLEPGRGVVDRQQDGEMGRGSHRGMPSF